MPFHDRINKAPPYLGDSANNAGFSCAAIKKSGSVLPGDGVYWITAGGGPFQAYCDMSLDGGGWTLVARVIVNQNNMVTGSSGSTPIQPGQSSFAKLSDSMINKIRASSDYTGSTDIRMTCQFSSPITMYVSSSCSFNANQRVDSVPNCDRVTRSFEGSLHDMNPNEGTRGFGHHHSGGWFAYTSTHYSSRGCHADAYNSNGRNGNANGVMWVK